MDCPIYYPIISTDGLRVTTTNPVQAYRCSARDMNPVLPEYKSSVLPLRLPTLSCAVKVSLNNFIKQVPVLPGILSSSSLLVAQ